MKKLLLSLSISVASLVAFAQSANNVVNQQATIKFSPILGLGVTYEKSISSNNTVHGSVQLPILGFAASNGIQNNGTYGKVHSLFPLQINVENRYYYNFDRRRKLEKNTDNNSANYVSAKFTYRSDKGLLNNTNEPIGFIGVGVNYGLQRSYNNKWITNFNFGLIAINNAKYQFPRIGLLPNLDFSISYKL